METILLIVGLAVGLLVAAWVDVRAGRIPNWLTFPLASFGLLVHTVNNGWDGLVFSFSGLFLGMGFLMFFYIKGGMGAGDVKLLGAIGAIVGPLHVFYAFAFAAILGGLYSLAMMMMLGGMRQTWERVLVLFTTLKVTKSMPAAPNVGVAEPKLRYALVLGLGTVITQTLFFYGML